MALEHDCLIIGGGVVGLSLAYELAGKGRRVTVLETGQTGRGASWAGAGILPPPLRENINDPLDQLRFLSHVMHEQWAAELLADLGLDTGLRRSGGLYLATSPGEAASLIGLTSFFQGHGVEARPVEISELTAIEPELANAVQAGAIQAALYCPEELQLRNPRHLQAMTSGCRARGVEIIEHRAALSLSKTNDGRVRVETAAGAIDAQAVCLAAGAWSLQLLDSIGLANGVFPVRGQMLLYRCPSPPIQRILNVGPRYIVARDDGHVLAGSSEEEVGFEVGTTEKMVGSLRRFAEELVGALNEENLERTWAGLRPGSFDGSPYIGAVTGLENLFVATGHFRSGLHMSTGTARVLAQLICGESPEIDLSSFSPTRG
jgi:glycine oxidase